MRLLINSQLKFLFIAIPCVLFLLQLVTATQVDVSAEEVKQEAALRDHLNPNSLLDEFISSQNINGGGSFVTDLARKIQSTLKEMDILAPKMKLAHQERFFWNRWSRSAGTKVMRTLIQNQHRPFLVQGHPERIFTLPRGPILYPGSLAFGMAIGQMVDLLSTGYDGLEKYMADQMLAGDDAEMSLEDIRQMYNTVSDRIEFPNILKGDWQSDEQFADLRLTYWGHMMRKVENSVGFDKLKRSERGWCSLWSIGGDLGAGDA
eukprot:Nk52_evm9s216 gene=Nk52_evmTU9s216